MLYNEYIKNLEIGEKSENTIRTYKRDLHKFVEFFNLQSYEDLNKLQQSDYRNFVASLQGVVSPVSINGLLRNLSAFITWALDNELISNDSFRKVKFGKGRFIKVEKTIKDVLTNEEAEAVIKAGSNIQEKFMLALMLFTGIRRDEVTKIKLTDINENVILINGKGSKQRKIFLEPTLAHMLSIYKTERNSQSEYLFYHGDKTEKLTGTTINNRVLAACQKAGITKKITAHRLRATLVTNIIKEFDIYTAMKVAGHSSINTTRIYDASGDATVMNALLNRKQNINIEEPDYASDED